MKRRWILGLALALAGGLARGEAESAFKFTMDFEKPLKRGYFENGGKKVFVNPSDAVKWDGSGAQAHDGKGAAAVPAKADITIDCPRLEAGKTYTIIVWARAGQPGVPASVALVWFGPDGKSVARRDAVQVKAVDREWFKLSKTGKAPEHTRVYFQLVGGSEETPIWFDGLTVVEE